MARRHERSCEADPENFCLAAGYRLALSGISPTLNNAQGFDEDTERQIQTRQTISRASL